MKRFGHSFLLGLVAVILSFGFLGRRAAGRDECLTNPNPDYWAAVLSSLFRLTITYYPDENTACDEFNASVAIAQAAAAQIPTPPAPCVLYWPHEIAVAHLDADASLICNSEATTTDFASIADQFTGARAKANSSAQSDRVETANSLWTGEMIFVRSSGEYGNCTCTGLSAATSSVASAIASSHRVFVAIDPEVPTEVEVVATVTAVGSWSTDIMNLQTGDSMISHGCPPPAYSCFPWYPYDWKNPWEPPGTGQRLQVVEASIVVNATDGEGETTATTRGVMMLLDGAPAIRLGLFAASEFASDNNGNFSAVVDAPVGGAIQNVESVGARLVIDCFREHDGDIDGDGNHCWTDRVLISRALGSTINDPTYRARADFDLDGDVDATDVAVFNSFHDIGTELTPPCGPPCQGDANIDGSINFGDITSVLENWGGSGPWGDANRDGTVNSADTTSVLTNWGAPCF